MTAYEMRISDWSSDVCSSDLGAWFQGLNDTEQSRFARVFAKLPVAIQVQTPAGLVGLVHAECPVDDWAVLEEQLARKTVRSQAMWSRDRYEAKNTSIVKGVREIGRASCRERVCQYV